MVYFSIFEIARKWRAKCVLELCVICVGSIESLVLTSFTTVWETPTFRTDILSWRAVAFTNWSTVSASSSGTEVVVGTYFSFTSYAIEGRSGFVVCINLWLSVVIEVLVYLSWESEVARNVSVCWSEGTRSATITKPEVV